MSEDVSLFRGFQDEEENFEPSTHGSNDRNNLIDPLRMPQPERSRFRYVEK